jgi:hypothetical protein
VTPSPARTFGVVEIQPTNAEDAGGRVPDKSGPVRAPSTGALANLEAELAELEAELKALEAGDGGGD